SFFFRLLFCLISVLLTAVSYSLSLHDALPISALFQSRGLLAHSDFGRANGKRPPKQSGTHALSLRAVPVAEVGHQLLHLLFGVRSEEHTSELQSRFDLVCRLLLEKKMMSEN